MKHRGALLTAIAAVLLAGAAFAQDHASIAIGPDTTTQAKPKPVAVKATNTTAVAAPAPTASTTASATSKDGKFNPFKLGAPPPPAPLVPPKPIALILRGLDKITGRPSVIVAPINQPVQYATLTITARYCYSTPQSETPETSAFLQIDEHRPDQPPRRVFSGWMYASSPALNGMEHPIYDVWVITCKTNVPSENRAVASTAVVKPKSPDAGAKDEDVELPDGADQ
jgi:hypothetical protein